MREPLRPDTLPEIEAAAWRELAAATRSKEHGWRVATLATVEGGGPSARSVVLREVDARKRRIVIYTDSRSPKVQQIEAQPQGVLVAWSAALSWQVRLGVRLEVSAAGLSVSSRWARLKLTPAAHDYLSPLPPGSPIERPPPERGSRAHFALMIAHVQTIDWLELGGDVQRRAMFDAEGARWVAP